MRKVFSHAEWGYLYVNIRIFALAITSFLRWKFTWFSKCYINHQKNLTQSKAKRQACSSVPETCLMPQLLLSSHQETTQWDKEDDLSQIRSWCRSPGNQYICSQSEPGHMAALCKWSLGSLTQKTLHSFRRKMWKYKYDKAKYLCQKYVHVANLSPCNFRTTRIKLSFATLIWARCTYAW